MIISVVGNSDETCLALPVKFKWTAMAHFSLGKSIYLSPGFIFTNPSARARYDTRSIQSFPSPRLVASPRLKNQSVLLFTHSWRDNNWIHTFPKGISAM